jgi:hypothetical protein
VVADYVPKRSFESGPDCARVSAARQEAKPLIAARQHVRNQALYELEIVVQVGEQRLHRSGPLFRFQQLDGLPGSFGINRRGSLGNLWGRTQPRYPWHLPRQRGAQGIDSADPQPVRVAKQIPPQRIAALAHRLRQFPGMPLVFLFRLQPRGIA